MKKFLIIFFMMALVVFTGCSRKQNADQLKKNADSNEDMFKSEGESLALSILDEYTGVWNCFFCVYDDMTDNNSLRIFKEDEKYFLEAVFDGKTEKSEICVGKYFLLEGVSVKEAEKYDSRDCFIVELDGKSLWLRTSYLQAPGDVDIVTLFSGDSEIAAYKRKQL